MEKVPWDVGRRWGRRGGWLGVREREREMQDMPFGGSSDIRSLFQWHSPGGATV